MTHFRALVPPLAALGVSCSSPSSTPRAETPAPTSVTPAGAMNPFASPSPLPFEAPRFDVIATEHFQPALDAGMRQQRAEVNAIASETAEPSFDNTIVALERSGRMLRRVQAVFGALVQANTSEALQRAQRAEAPRLAAHSDAIQLDAALFARVKAIHDRREQLGLDAEQRMLVERCYRDFVRAGALLAEPEKVRLRALNEESARLSTEFSRKLLAATKAAALVVDDRAELAGLSEGEIAAAADAAESRGLSGKYLLALQNTTQQPAQASLSNRATRERLYNASIHRADRGDENDTRAIVARLAELRAERASLLGYATHADFVLDNQMSRTPAAAVGLLSQLVPPAAARVRAEAASIQALIDRQGGGFKLAPWDWQYYSEQVRRAEHDLDASRIKPYFELDRVLRDGVFFAANRMYGLTFEERKDLPVYHPDVRVFEVFEPDGSHLALLYFDSFKRDNKAGGAWMGTFVGQSRLEGTSPVVYNVTNFTRPAAGQRALLTFDDTRTLFHEFGHALHGMFSSTTYPRLSGTSVPRDFVEMPSQLNEHWALEPAVFANYAKHYQTGEPMPQSLVDRIRKAAKYNQGFAITEYLAAALLDLAWHAQAAGAPRQEVDAFERAALARFGVDLAEVPPRYHSTYFSHIWTSAYAAAYYAYMWSELIDHDAYYWFLENGGMTRANGQRFRDMILSRGSTVDADEMFRAFRGRDPKIEPLLVERGLQALP
jgi:peptidyl-dipeptidase Dcp